MPIRPGPVKRLKTRLPDPPRMPDPEADDLDLHPHAGILVDPAARLDVDELARAQDLLEDVAVAVQPEDAAAPRRR